MKLQANGKTVEIKAGDKFKMEMFNHGLPGDVNREYTELVEIKKAGKKEGKQAIREYVYKSTFKNLKGEEVVTNPEDGYHQWKFLTPYDAEKGWGIKIIDENTWEHFSDDVIQYRATRI
jgi:hypothetical protein